VIERSCSAVELARKSVSEPGKVSPKVGAVLACDGVIIYDSKRKVVVLFGGRSAPQGQGAVLCDTCITMAAHGRLLGRRLKSRRLVTGAPFNTTVQPTERFSSAASDPMVIS